MAAGGMAGKAERPAAEIRDGIGGSRDFGCDLCDPRLRRQRVANHRHRPATRQRARGKMREIILRQRHPVAAMHNGEHAPRGFWVALRREKVVSLALTLAIGLVKGGLRPAGPECRRAVRQGLEPRLGARDVGAVFIGVVEVGRRNISQ